MTQSAAPVPCRPRRRRRILCLFPRYSRSFGTLHHAYPLIPGVRAFMPPQGLLVISAWLEERGWQVRFVDENVRPAGPEDFEWADAVLTSGMHVQREHLRSVARRARQAGRLCVAGGPSVSGCPEWYPDFDVLHLGELGDATEELLELIDRDPRPRQEQVLLRTRQRLPLERFPIPAYHLADLSRYFIGSLQFSSGCPYRCEFCDIPALYGGSPRTKTPEQVLAELDALVAAGCRGAVYFVDDNFVAHRKAAARLLPHLVAWQRARGYPLEMACEATLNITQSPELLEQMRQAFFTTLFAGIETPDPAALRAMHKEQNLLRGRSIPQAVAELNSYGIEVVSGIIMGLDTDTPDSARRLLEFIEETAIPMLTINILYALPKTPLYQRLAAQGRILARENGLDSNVRFLLPYETVRRNWLEAVTGAYEPEALYRRFSHQMSHTYCHRLQPPAGSGRVNARNLWMAASILGRMLWHIGLRSHYRTTFWRFALPALQAGRLEDLIHVGVVGHHLIQFARECAEGKAESSFYSDSPREELPRAG